MKRFILNLLRIYDKSNWFIKKENSDIKNSLFKTKIIPTCNKVSLETTTKINKGWYLYGIKYRGNNQFVFGDIFLKRSKFNQGRPMNAGKYRWRVLRIKIDSKLELILNNVFEEISILNIWLIPLPSFEAWRRILKKNFEIKSIYYKRRKNKKLVWLDYNRIFNRKFGNSKQEEYRYWIHNNEKFNLIKLSKKRYKKHKLVLIKKNNIKKINDDSWAIVTLEEGSLSLWAYDSINFAISKNKNLSILYTDEDCLSKDGIRSNPHFKPAWNKELFISDPYYSGIWIIKGELWNKNLNKKSFCLNTIIYSMILNLDKEFESKIYHLPIIAFHRFTHEKKPKRPLAKIELREIIKKNLINNKSRFNKILDLKILPSRQGYFAEWALPKESMLSIIIPTKNKYDLLNKCIKSIYENKPNIDFEIIILNNDSYEESTKKYFDHLKNIENLKIIDIPGKFNYSKLNNIGAKYAAGNVLLLLNNDVMFLKSDWGRLLASNALREEVGCVGAKLIYEDKTIQHGGVILGIGGVAGHAHKYEQASNMGYQSRLILSQEITALTGACLAISKLNWENLNGLNEKNLKVNYNDVDLCLRAREIGLKNIFLPSVYGVHLESKTRGKPKGRSFNQWRSEFYWMKNKWSKVLNNDPAYNPNLSLIYEDFSIGSERNSNIQVRNNIF